MAPSFNCAFPGMKLVREATEAAETKKEKEREAGKAATREAGSSSPENQFIRGVIALHDKYMEYVQVGADGSSCRQVLQAPGMGGGAWAASHLQVAREQQSARNMACCSNMDCVLSWTICRTPLATPRCSIRRSKRPLRPSATSRWVWGQESKGAKTNGGECC